MDWLVLVAAPFAGSTLGVLVRRLPAGRPVALARSACEACGHRLAARDLVPLLSFSMLRGRCRYCGGGIGWFHPAIEGAAVVVAAWAMLAGSSNLWADCVLGWVLLALAWIDYDHMRLPDALTLPLLLGGLGVAWFDDPELVFEHALAAALGWGLFRGVALAYRAWRGRDGLGAGDAKLLAAAGAWVGLAGLGDVVLLAGVLGLGFALSQIGGGRSFTLTTRVPFGPALALATWIVRVHGTLGDTSI